MDNRFEHEPPEERQDWGRYATPPALPGEKHSQANRQSPEPLRRQTVTSLCDRVQETLPALLENDGSIRPEMATAIRAHLSGCADCAREYREMQQLIALIETMPLAEMPRDYSMEIMQRIERQAKPALVSAQNLANGGGLQAQAIARTLSSGTKKTQTLGTTQTLVSRLSVFSRLFLSAILAGLLGFFVSSGWGRQALGVNALAVSEWLGQAAGAIRSIPLLGWAAAGAFAALSQAGETLQTAFHNLGASAMTGMAFDAAFGGAACAFILGRQRMQSRGYDGRREG